MRLLLVSFLALLLFACNNDSKTSKNSIPSAPADMQSAKNQLNGHSFDVTTVAFTKTFMGKEEPMEWESDRKDTSKHYKDYIAELKKFSLEFKNDSMVTITKKEKSYSGTWSVDTVKADDEAVNTMKLRITYPDPEFQMFGSTTVSNVTYTYKIKGIDDKSVMLESPASYNDQYAVLLMKRR